MKESGTCLTEVGIPGHQVPGSDFDAPVRRIKTLFGVF